MPYFHGVKITEISDITGHAGSTPVTPPAPVLTLSGPLAFVAGAAAGTLVANIGNVPAGSTPTLTPNDGRLVVAGSAGSWRVVVGLTASSSGEIALSVSAAGATGASAAVTVAAAGGAIPELAGTTLSAAEYQAPNALLATYNVDPSLTLEPEGEPFWLNRLALTNPTAGVWELRTGAERLNWWKDRDFCSLSPAFKLTQTRTGSAPVSQKLTLNLSQAVRVPSWPAVPYLPLLREGETFELDLAAFQDGGGGTTTYAIVSGAPAGTTINAGTGIVTFAPAVGAAGDYDNIIFSATNSAGTGSVTFRMWVIPEKWTNWTGHSVDQATGLTNLVLHPSARRVWVNSISGSQSNDGLTPATARQSVRAPGIGTSNTASAYEMIRNGMGDHLMISSNSIINGGDFFFNQSGSRSLASKTGLSAQYPIVITSYDVSDPSNEAMYGILRPNISADGATPFSHTTGEGGKYYIIRGFDMGATRGPMGLNTIRIENIHYENMKFGDFVINTDESVKRSMRFCTSRGPFSSGMGIGPSGTHSADQFGEVKEGCVFTHSGWNTDRLLGFDGAGNGGATIYNHGDYQSIPTRFAGTFMSIYDEASATGAQYRSGIRIDRVTFTRCPISLQLGGGNDNSIPFDPGGASAPSMTGPQSGLTQRSNAGAHEGVFALATRIIIDQGNDRNSASIRGIGIHVQNLAKGSRIENYLITNHISAAANPPPLWIYGSHNLWSRGSTGEDALRPNLTKADLCDPYGRWDTGVSVLFSKGTVHRAGTAPPPSDSILTKAYPFYNPEGTKIVTVGPKPWLNDVRYTGNVAPFGSGIAPADGDFVDPNRTVASFAVSRGYANQPAWIESLVNDPLKIRTEYLLLESYLLGGFKLSAAGIAKHGAAAGAVAPDGSWTGYSSTIALTVPVAKVGQVYPGFTASGGTPPYTFAAITGLPAGLTSSSALGATGTPTEV